MFLMSSYDWQEVSKRSPVSTWFLCAVGAQSVSSWEPGLSLVSLVDGQAVFTESSQGFIPFWVGHSGQVFCNGVVTVESQYTVVFGGLFPMCQIIFLLFFYNLVLPDVLVVV